MGRLLHCFGMFIRDIENRKYKQPVRQHNEQPEMNKIIKLVIYCCVLFGIIGFISDIF